jgi:hypothetical protein
LLIQSANKRKSKQQWWWSTHAKISFTWYLSSKIVDDWQLTTLHYTNFVLTNDAFIPSCCCYHKLIVIILDSNSLYHGTRVPK